MPVRIDIDIGGQRQLAKFTRIDRCTCDLDTAALKFGSELNTFKIDQTV